MKIGIFGDSFADHRNGQLTTIIGEHTNFSWPCLLRDAMDCPADLEGQSGTSIFYSYEKFMSLYKEYTHVVFVYSYPWRYPYLRHDLIENDRYLHWLYNKDDRLLDKLGLDKDLALLFKSFNRAVPYILPDQLLNFIAKHVIREVNEICHKNNIKLVNVFLTDRNTEPYNVNDLSFSAIDHLDKVCSDERFNIRGNSVSMTEICNRGNVDYRYCHLLPENNRKLAGLILSLFDKKEFISTDNISGWAISDDRYDQLYSNIKI